MPPPLEERHACQLESFLLQKEMDTEESRFLWQYMGVILRTDCSSMFSNSYEKESNIFLPVVTGELRGSIWRQGKKQ